MESNAELTSQGHGPIVEGQIVGDEIIQKGDALTTSEPRPLVHAEQVSSPDPFLAIIEKAVMLPAFDVEKLDKLLAVVRQREMDQAQKKFDIAMADFKKESPEILRNREVSFPTKGGTQTTNYSHATLDNVCEVLVKKLSEHGFRHRWKAAQPDKSTVIVTCVIRHEAGAFEETTLQGPPDDSGGKNDIQAVGSTVTYLERYTLLAACGLAVKGQDTDGRAGGVDLSQAACPKCGNIGAVIASKPEWGGGYVCYKKRGGCGEKFQELPGQEGEAKEASKGPNPRANIRTFSGKVLEMVEKQKAGNPVLKLRIKGAKMEFWVINSQLVSRLEGIPNEKLKQDGIAIGATEQKGSGNKKFWEVVELQRVPGPQSPPTSHSAPSNEGAKQEAPKEAAKEAPKPKPEEAKPKPATVAAPEITDVDVLVWKGRGDHKKQVQERWKRCIGRVQNVSGILRTTKKSQYMQVLIEGLPAQEVEKNATYVPYCLFRTFHGSLYEVLAQSKGKLIDFLYTLDLRDGVYYQMLEEINYMDGQKYVDGKAEIPASQPPDPPLPPKEETSSPNGLFSR
jgi:ERF superfamily